MNSETALRLGLLARQLTESLMNAAFCAKEIDEIARGVLEGKSGQSTAGNNRQDGRPFLQARPLMDEGSLAVVWNGKTLHLGHTRCFWLLMRLCRRPNQYVTHLDLLRDVWDDDSKDSAVLRTVVRRLRVKLRQGGMDDLAAAIVGHNGRYMLDLGRAGCHRDVTAAHHPMSQD